MTILEACFPTMTLDPLYLDFDSPLVEKRCGRYDLALANMTSESCEPSWLANRYCGGRNRKNRRHRARNKLERVGAALVEFAIIAPIMMLFTLGLIEMGRMTMVKQLLVNISREGARLATLPAATSVDVQSEIEELLENSRVFNANVTINPSILSSSNAGSMVTVTISVRTEDVSWLRTPIFMSGMTIEGSTSMRRESL